MSEKISRRDALKLATIGIAGGVLAACAPEAPAPTPTAVPPTAIPASPVAPPSVSPAAAATGAPATAIPATAVPTAAPPPLAANIAQAATQYLQALNGGALEKTRFAFDNTAERTRWHWTTPGGFPRNGLALRDMDENQRVLALALLRASVAEAGLKKSQDIMSLQRDLGNDPTLYFVSIFGEPGSAQWGWRFEGHHLSRHFTVVNDQVATMPFFNGSWPTVSDTGLRAMEREEDAAREIITSLDDARRARAIFQERSLTRHETWNAVSVSPLGPVGIPVGELDPAQKERVIEIIETYLASLEPSLAQPIYDRLKAAGVDAIQFGWAGSLEPRRPQYYRLQGPTFLLEFDNSRNGGTHVHSVWRDFDGDFGMNLV
jgi:hypothetical protein